MGEHIRVVARLEDGAVVKGTTQDFFPNRPRFHVVPNDGSPAVEVVTAKLKAVFFVKDLAGHAERVDLKGFLAAPAETGHGKKVAVLFRDGELICGYALSYTPGRDGFFLFPADTAGNNIRIYVLLKACRDVKAGPAAEALAVKILSDRAA